MAPGKRINSVLVILSYIFFGVMCENVLVEAFHRMNCWSEWKSTSLIMWFFLLQIFCAPIQGGLSDFYTRKKSLLFGIVISLISLFLSYLVGFKGFVLIPAFLMLTLMGMGGNTLPIAFAAIADTQITHYRITFAKCTGAFAVAYLACDFLGENANTIITSVAVILLGFVILFATIFRFVDPADSSAHVPENIDTNQGHIKVAGKLSKKEYRFILQDLRDHKTRRRLEAFFLWELSIYSILIGCVDFSLVTNHYLVPLMMGGYLTGVIILRLTPKLKDSTVIKQGYYISFLALIPYLILDPFGMSTEKLLAACYFVHAVGNAFLSPTLMTYLAKEKKSHEQGRTYGLVDSVDTFAYAIATIGVIFYKSVHLSIYWLVLFSFVSFAFSWFFLSQFHEPSEGENLA